MLAHTRHQKILAILDKRQRAGSAELQSATGVSSATLRRDLDFLERQDLVVRVHGAVLHPSVASAEPSLLQKSRSAVQAKRKIAAKSAALIPERAIVFIDSGTTCLEADAVGGQSSRGGDEVDQEQIGELRPTDFDSDTKQTDAAGRILRSFRMRRWVPRDNSKRATAPAQNSATHWHGVTASSR